MANLGAWVRRFMGDRMRSGPARAVLTSEALAAGGAPIGGPIDRFASFKITWRTVDLRPALSALGVADACDRDRADFAGMSGHRSPHAEALMLRASTTRPSSPSTRRAPRPRRLPPWGVPMM